MSGSFVSGLLKAELAGKQPYLYHLAFVTPGGSVAPFDRDIIDWGSDLVFWACARRYLDVYDEKPPTKGDVKAVLLKMRDRVLANPAEYEKMREMLK